MKRSFLVERDGLRLSTIEEGNLEGPLVVFVHGYPDDKTVWDGVVSLLREDFRILRYDVRGAGFSDVPTTTKEYHLRELTADLEAVVDAVAPGESFHVVGHDWGSIQLWEAVTDPSFQERIRSFVSVSGPSLDHVAHQLRTALRSGGVRERLRAANQALRSWYIGMFQLPVLPELAWSQRAAPWVEKRIAAMERIPMTAFNSPQRSQNGTSGVQLYRANVRERIKSPQVRRSDVPIRVLVPQGDAYVSHYIAHSCEPWVSSLEFQPVDGGHWFYLTRPEIFADAVRVHVNTYN